jgi:hypothetical protein
MLASEKLSRLYMCIVCAYRISCLKPGMELGDAGLTVRIVSVYVSVCR